MNAAGAQKVGTMRSRTKGSIWETWTADKDGKDFAEGDELESFTIITTTLNDTVKQLHNRMPVILPPYLWSDWLDCSVDNEVLQPYEGDARFYRVSRDVDSVRNDTPDVIGLLKS